MRARGAETDVVGRDECPTPVEELRFGGQRARDDGSSSRLGPHGRAKPVVPCAHAITGRLVALCASRGCELDEVSDEDLRSVSDHLDADVRTLLAR